MTTLHKRAELARAELRSVPSESTVLVADAAGLSRRWISYYRNGGYPNAAVGTIDRLEKGLKEVTGYVFKG